MGANIPNEGERKCLMMTKGAESPKRITSQVADVHNTLLSITRAADAGYECHLNAKGGHSLDTFTGEKILIARERETCTRCARGSRWTLTRFLRSWIEFNNN